MAETIFWDQEQFPIVYEEGEAKAVLVDIVSFNQMEIIVDNLLNREAEPEDAILAASTALRQILARAKQQPPTADWEKALDEL